MKKIVTILIAIALIAMMGTAAASPEFVEMREDGTSTQFAGILPLVNDGITDNPFDLYFWDYDPNTSGESHTLVVTVTPYDGNPLAAGEIYIALDERGTGAASNSATSGAASSSVSCTLVWEQDDDGTDLAGTSESDTIDVNIRSNGVDSRKYNIAYEDWGAGFDHVAENSKAANIPEFPTIALPVAAFLGLAFIFQRRREED